jgi:CheY-like chemotaxis protein
MNSPTLLCIDDRPQMLELRKSTLEMQGYSVKLASNGYDAIKTLEEAGVQTGRHGRGICGLPY